MTWSRALQRWRVPLSYLFAVIFLMTARPRPASIFVGLILMTAGALVRTWASGHIRKKKVLATTGPYACCRNPLYFGSSLIAAGALWMAWNWWLTILGIGMAVPLYWTVMRREEHKLTELFGREFKEYKAAVPLLFPRMPPSSSGSQGQFNWQLVWKHREWKVWVGITLTALYMTAFVLWQR